jgi:hypothetical protein
LKTLENLSKTTTISKYTPRPYATAIIANLNENITSKEENILGKVSYCPE